mmetsp:Transcript_655/g.1435  ORF Transcript_655/g.1435 Transcript_655/m.1435 type:complete len:367 (+) Transcript_655:727-1827(+)
MVEVVHHQAESVVLLPQKILHGHLAIVKDDQGSARGRGVSSLDLACLHIVIALNQQHRDTLGSVPARPHGSHEVISVHPFGDPLLDAVDNVELAAGRLLRGGADRAHIAAGEGLGNRQARRLLTLEASRPRCLPDVVAAKVEDGWHGDHPPSTQGINEPREAKSRDFHVDNHLVEVIVLLHRHIARNRNTQVLRGLEPRPLADPCMHHTRCAQPFLQLGLRVIPINVGLHGNGNQLLLHEFASCQQAPAMRIVVVRRVHALEAGDLRKGNRTDPLGKLSLFAGCVQAADDELLVLLQHIRTVQLKKFGGHITATQLLEHLGAAGVQLRKLADIVDISSYSKPKIPVFVVLLELRRSDGACHDGREN